MEQGLQQQQQLLTAGSEIGDERRQKPKGFVAWSGICLQCLHRQVCTESLQTSVQSLMSKTWAFILTDACLIVIAGGTVGMICTSLFATTSVNAAGTDGGFYGHGLHFAKTLAVLALVVPWICIFTYGCLFVTDKIMTLRVSGEIRRSIRSDISDLIRLSQLRSDLVRLDLIKSDGPV